MNINRSILPNERKCDELEGVRLISALQSSDGQPREIICEIFSYLLLSEMHSCRRVCRHWRSIVNNDFKFQVVWESAFGKRQWEKCRGEVPPEPYLSIRHVADLLESPCPIWAGLKVHQTHSLFLMPEAVDNRLLTISYLREMGLNPKDGIFEDGDRYSFNFEEKNQDVPVGKSCWVLGTKRVLPGSEGRCLQEQKLLLFDLGQRAGAAYRAPKIFECWVQRLSEDKRMGKGSLITEGEKGLNRTINLFSDFPGRVLPDSISTVQDFVNFIFPIPINAGQLPPGLSSEDPDPSSEDFGQIKIRLFSNYENPLEVSEDPRTFPRSAELICIHDGSPLKEAEFDSEEGTAHLTCDRHGSAGVQGFLRL